MVMIAGGGMLILAVFVMAMFFLIFYMSIKTKAPEAFMFMKARKLKVPIVMVHYPEGIVKATIPHKDGADKNTSMPYWIVDDVGIKFRSPDGRKAERWNGEIPIYHYFRDIPEPVSITEAVAYSQFRDYLKSKGAAIDNMEDVVFYVINELERTGDIEQAIANANITDENTKRNMLSFIDYIIKHKKEVNQLKLRSGVFTFQTAARALDATIAYTSSNVAHTKSVLEAAIRRQLDAGKQEAFKYGMFIIMACLGVAIVMKVGFGS